MTLVLCACNVYLVDPENSTYVRDFKPLCHEETCRKVHEHDKAGLTRASLPEKLEEN